MSVVTGIERDMQAACLAVLLADPDLITLHPDICHAYDQTKPRAAVQCMVECDQLANLNTGETGRGTYYTARLSVMCITSLDVDPEAKTMQRVADRVRAVMFAAAFRAALNAVATQSVVDGITANEPEGLYEMPIIGRAHVVTLHLHEV